MNDYYNEYPAGVKIGFWIFISTLITAMLITNPTQFDEVLEDIHTIADSTIVDTIPSRDTTIMDSPIILEDSSIITVYATMYHPVIGNVMIVQM